MLALMVSSTLAGDCSESDKKRLKKMDQDWGTYNQQQDKASLDAILADGFASFNLSSTTDKAAAMAALDTSPPANAPSVTSDSYIISCSGDTAVMTHRNEIRSDSGTSFARSVHIFQKQGGAWKVIASVNHSMDEAGALIYKNYSGMAAYKARDGKWFDKNMHDGYFYVAPTGEIRSRSESIEGIVNDKNKYDMMEMSGLNAQIDGDMGIVTGIVHTKGTDAEGNPFDTKLRFTRTFKKIDGDWKALATHSSFVEDPQ